MATNPKPLTSYSPKLIALLLRAALDPIILYAERDKSPPQLVSRKEPGYGESPRDVVTRWHIARFSNPEAAQRFREFTRLAQRLHALRQALRAHNHPDTDKAYSVRISIDDRTGSMTIAPADRTLDQLLTASGDTHEVPTIPQSLDDPLAKL